MIEYNDYRFQNENDLKVFLDKIPERLQSLSQTLSEWDGNTYDFTKKNGTYSDFILSYDLVRNIEKWVLEVSKKTKTLPREQVLQVCSLLGEIVVNRSTGKWHLNENELREDGLDVDDRLIPSVYGWSDFVHDFPFTPLFSLEHFIRTRTAHYLESSIRYSTEEGDARFEAGGVGEDELELIDGLSEEDHQEIMHVYSNQFGDGQDGLDVATEFIEDELDFFTELLEEYDIELNLERDELDFIIDRSFYSDEKLALIETFFQKNANGINEIDRVDMGEMMSAYLAEVCATRLEGFPDYLDDELVVLWSESETETGKLIISELLDKIEKLGAGTTSKVLSKCVIHPTK